ncbi:MAG: MFS transporter [Bacillota bacterium]|nr:MFS transporter [Bacillota bacterium]
MKWNKRERSWALYDWANSAYTMTVTTAVFPLFFKAAAAQGGVGATESTAMLGFANSFATLIVALFSPILGTIADYYGFKNRMFNTFLAIGVTATVLLGIIPESGYTMLLGVYMLTLVGYSGANVFYDSFIVDVTEDDRMDELSTYGYAIGYIGSTIPFIMVMAVIMLSDAGVLPFTGFQAPKIGFLITAVWWLAFSMPMIRNVRQVHGIPREKQVIRKSFARLRSTFRDIKTYKPAFIFLIAYFFYIDGVDTIIKMASSYGSDLGIDNTSLLVILLVSQFVAFPSAIAYGKLAKRFTGKTMIYVAIVGYTAICIYAAYMRSVVDFWILAVVVGLFQGGIQAISRSYFAKLIPKHKANEFFGFFNIFGKFAAIMGPSLMGGVALLTGKSSYGAMSLVILFVLGGLILMKVKPTGTTESK